MMTLGSRLVSNRRVLVTVCSIRALAILLAVVGGSSRAAAALRPRPRRRSDAGN